MHSAQEVFEYSPASPRLGARYCGACMLSVAHACCCLSHAPLCDWQCVVWCTLGRCCFSRQSLAALHRA